MLGKKFSLGSVVEETGEARIKLANFDELREQGSDIASFISTFKPDPGYVYLHVIAMGAGEYYGCNINGDYFPEKDLIERHHTFVTNAKVFKEHDNKPMSPSYGHVVFSWYNPKMHRVELILAIDKVKGKEFIDRQARGEQLEVSMGCRVREDVCSICGNKARKRSDYCEHILRDKRKIYPDGRQPYMINYNPTFFDISVVRRRADKIAYVLEKVASRDTTVSSLNAQAFDELDSLIPVAEPPQVFDIEEDFEKTANVEKRASDLDKLAMIKRIQSEAVKVLNTGLEETMPLLEATEPDLPPALLDATAKKHRLEDIMTTFTVNAIPMKPEEFTRIIIVKRGMPLDTFADVLKGVKSAVADRDLKMGEYKDDIGKTLQAYLIARSSFLPAVISRLAGALRNRDALA